MSASSLTCSALIATFWIYSVLAAPVEEENSVMEKNMTGTCIRDILPSELQLHYDMCLGNNLSGDNLLKEKDILLCVLKTASVISGEEIDTSKLKMPSISEEETPDMKMIEDDNPFMMSVERCEAKENMEKAEEFALCLYDTISMSCPKEVSSSEESDAAVEER